MLADWSLACLSSERLYQQLIETEADTANVGLRSETPMEELGEGLKELKRMAISQEDQQCQLTWTPGSSQRLRHQPKSIHDSSKAPDTYVAEDCLVQFQ